MPFTDGLSVHDETMHGMVERSSIDTAASLAAAGIGGHQLFRIFQRLRHRATHPDMEDPGKQLMHWVQWVALGLAATVVAASVALLTWLGPVAIILVVAALLVAVVVWIIVALGLWSVAEQRRRDARYVICEADYADAPRQIKSTMRRIYRSAQSVRSGPAYQRDMFGDLSLDQVVYSAAERAILSSELAAGARDLRPDATAGDQTLLDGVNKQIGAIKGELATVEAAFKRSGKTAETLSARITEPERQRAAEQARTNAAAAAADRRERARTRLEEVSMRANVTTDLGHVDVEDRIGAVAAGYAEAKQVSDETLNDLNGVKAHEADAPNTSSSNARDSVLRVAKFTAGQAAKWSTLAAKAGADKLKNRDDGLSPKR